VSGSEKWLCHQSPISYSELLINSTGRVLCEYLDNCSTLDLIDTDLIRKKVRHMSNDWKLLLQEKGRYAKICLCASQHWPGPNPAPKSPTQHWQAPRPKFFATRQRWQETLPPHCCFLPPRATVPAISMPAQAGGCRGILR
jgi:hypothetical protein